MKVKRSSSSTAATASSSGVGVRPRTRGLVPSAGRSAKVRTCRGGQLDRARVDLRALLLVLARATPIASECSSTYAHVVRRAVRVDRRADGADEREREVEERPLERRPREDRRTRRPCGCRARAGRSRARRRARPPRSRRPPPAVRAVDEVRRARCSRRPRRARARRSCGLRPVGADSRWPCSRPSSSEGTGRSRRNAGSTLHWRC